jgi:transposase
MPATLSITLPDFEVESVESTTEAVCINAVSIKTAACCPDCGQVGRRIHSWYTRHPVDLPCMGRIVRLVLSVRRYFCDNANCGRQTFAERFEPWLARYARRTWRILNQIGLLSLAVGGEGASVLTEELGIPTSAATVIRVTRRQSVEPVPTPRVLGVDDWAMRKGRRYGTILVDLEAHCPIDLLPDREANTFANWLQAHPGVEVISRDRGTAYSEGATKGAPNAVQIADRWHLLHNLDETVQEMLEQHRAKLTMPVVQATTTEAPASPLTPASKKKAWAYNREERYKRYEQMVALAEQGLDNQAIAQAVGVSSSTVRSYLRAGQFPEWQPRPTVSKWLVPYLPYLEQRWEEGCHNAAQLGRELCQQGFNRSRQLVYNYVARLRNGLPTQAPPVQTPQVKVVRRYSPRQAAWLLVSPPDNLTVEQTEDVKRLRQACPQIEQTYQLAQEFGELVREQQPDALQPWMQRALDSAMEPLRSFVFGLHRDLAAVKAALALPWSNGQTEGQVNRLKLIKRQMYGRANFDLLRLRVVLNFKCFTWPH